MSINIEFFSHFPQQEIAEKMKEEVKNCDRISIVTYIITKGGIKSIIDDKQLSNLDFIRDKLKTLIVGKVNEGSCKALDYLLDQGFPNEKLRIHLGYAGKQGNQYEKYYPCVHSKIFLLETKNRAVAFVGSRNITSYALKGLNSEASVILTGDIQSQCFEEIRNHIESIKYESVPYQRYFKEVYIKWTASKSKNINKIKLNLSSEEDKGKEVILIPTENKNQQYTPEVGDTIYFEINDNDINSYEEYLRKINRLGDRINLVVYKTLPTSIIPEKLENEQKVLQIFDCKVQGLETGGMNEVQANWYIKNKILEKIQEKAYRPQVSEHDDKNRKQYRIEVVGKITGDCQYSSSQFLTKYEAKIDEVSPLYFHDNKVWFSVCGFEESSGVAFEDHYIINDTIPFITCYSRRKQG